MLSPIGVSPPSSNIGGTSSPATAALQAANPASSQAIQDILSISQQGMAASMSGGEGGMSGGEGGGS